MQIFAVRSEVRRSWRSDDKVRFCWQESLAPYLYLLCCGANARRIWCKRCQLQLIRAFFSLFTRKLRSFLSWSFHLCGRRLSYRVLLVVVFFLDLVCLLLIMFVPLFFLANWILSNYLDKVSSCIMWLNSIPFCECSHQIPPTFEKPQPLFLCNAHILWI